MSPSAPEPKKPALDPATILRYRSRRHAGEAEVALDRGDAAEFSTGRQLARLEREAAIEKELEA